MANSDSTPKSASNIIDIWRTWGPYMQGVLRIVAAFLFILAGTSKLFGFPATNPPSSGTLPFMSQLWIGGVLETFGGSLLLLGLFTRPVAFLLSGEMAVAYFQFHFPRGFWPITNGGMPAVLFCFIWLYFSAAGGGPLSLDAKRGK